MEPGPKDGGDEVGDGDGDNDDDCDGDGCGDGGDGDGGGLIMYPRCWWPAPNTSWVGSPSALSIQDIFDHDDHLMMIIIMMMGANYDDNITVNIIMIKMRWAANLYPQEKDDFLENTKLALIPPINFVNYIDNLFLGFHSMFISVRWMRMGVGDLRGNSFVNYFCFPAQIIEIEGPSNLREKFILLGKNMFAVIQ